MPPEKKPDSKSVTFSYEIILTAIAELEQGAMESTDPIAHQALLKIARLSTQSIERLLEEDAWPLILEAPHLENWPILYHQGKDLRPYKKLRIGHNLPNSRNLSKRATDEIGVFFAKELILRIEELSFKAKSVGMSPPPWLNEEYEKRRKLNQAENILRVGDRFPKADLLTCQHQISSFVPDWFIELKDIEDFHSASPKGSYKETTKRWATEGKRLFTAIYPKCEELTAFENTYTEIAKRSGINAQRRSLIVSGIGRSIKGLRPKEAGL